jgi:hypothetical protein
MSPFEPCTLEIQLFVLEVQLFVEPDCESINSGKVERLLPVLLP